MYSFHSLFHYSFIPKGIRFRYVGRDEFALKGIDLKVRAGEFVLISGPTGCGKSTLLKTLNGLIPAEVEGVLEGEVSIGSSKL